MAFVKHQAAMRITAVTALVVTLGAIAGGAMGLLLTAIGDAVLPGTATLPRPRIYGIGAAVGAIYGALIGTPIALLMLRRVPLWRATVETAAAAGLGTVVGRFIPVPFASAGAAVAFALLAAWRLRRAYAPRPVDQPERAKTLP
ncbi:MAG TPA: hypothetical protein VFO66_02090 [Gemmatimonadaceae bacterium]|nr:hypothetical protein [Gemmatimonadaceae bacterium]